MQQLWNQTLDKLEKEDGLVEEKVVLDSFTFATNNNGFLGGFSQQNAKNRSLAAIQSRRQVAQQLKKMNRFAYSKWELDPAHPLIAEMQSTLTEPHFLKSVETVLHQDYPHVVLSESREMSDLFATHYTQGDFLSTHNDGVSGSWAVVISLVEDDYDAKIHGGGLQFQCPGRGKAGFCETLHPKFNTAVVFGTSVKVGDTWESGPDHQVLDVLREEGGRYAITGWWMDAKGNEWPDDLRVERDKMRGIKK